MNSSVAANSQNAKFSTASHVIFDLDGTLIDTETIYGAIFKELCAKYGKTISEELSHRILGQSTAPTLQLLIAELSLPISYEEAEREFKNMARRSFGKVDMMPGAERLIKHLHKHKIPMAIATNSPRSSIGMKTAHLGKLINLVSHIVTVDDVKQGKPDPEMYLLACSKFPTSPKPAECLVFEDSVHGLNAAVAAKMQCVLTPHEGVKENDRKMATLVLKSMEEFKPEMFGLPPFSEN